MATTAFFQAKSFQKPLHSLTAVSAEPVATAYGRQHSYSSWPIRDSSLPMSEAKQRESHQEHMNANNTLCDCNAVKTFQRLITFPAVSHILHLAI